MSDDKILSVLRERLPDSYDLSQQTALIKRVSTNIATIRETFEESVSSYNYQDTPAPYEVNIDFGGLENTLNYIGEIVSDGNYTLKEIEEQLNETNFTLKNIDANTHQLPHIAQSLDTLHTITKFGVGVASLSLAVQERIRETEEEILEELVEQTYMLYSIEETLEEGFENVSQQIAMASETIVSTLDGGFSTLNKTLKRGNRILQAIDRHLRTVDGNQEQRHKDLIGTMTDLASRSYNLKAREKYKMAQEQFSVKNYTLALREVHAALREDSTYCPSLLLLGRISVQYGQWKIAKNSYYEASRLAMNRKDHNTFEVAILGISELEFLLGNREQAEKVIDNAIEEYAETGLTRLRRRKFDLVCVGRK